MGGTERFELGIDELPEILTRLRDGDRALSERLALAIGEYVDLHHRQDGTLHRQLRDGVVATDVAGRRTIVADLVGDVIRVELRPFQS